MTAKKVHSKRRAGTEDQPGETEAGIQEESQKNVTPKATPESSSGVVSKSEARESGPLQSIPTSEASQTMAQEAVPTLPLAGSASGHVSGTRAGALPRLASRAALILVAGYLVLELVMLQGRNVATLPISALLVSYLGLKPAIAEFPIIGLLVAEIVGILLWMRTKNRPITTSTVDQRSFEQGLPSESVEAKATQPTQAAEAGRPSKEVTDERTATPLQASGKTVEESKPGDAGTPTKPSRDIQEPKQIAVGGIEKPLATYMIDKANPEVFVTVEKDPITGGIRYVLNEPELTVPEKRLFERLKSLLIDELDVDVQSLRDSGRAQSYLTSEVRKVADKYGLRLNPVTAKKLGYRFTRDFIKLGRIEPLMNDPLIEDISCDGPGIPLYVWHRDYESVPTNVVFEDDEELNTFVSKLAYVSKKHISIASPMLDATLPDGSRIQITYGREVTKKGSTFTIRKFKAEPLTVVDLIRGNTLNAEIAAYLWYITEKRLSSIVAGGTACGKTTSLNALSMFIPPDQKIVSVEDTPELNLPHENWIQSVSRGGTAMGEITLFDLLRAALRQRPDIIIVGEVRGAEAFTLFQAIATGHGGLGTVHADSVEAAIARLTSEPMNVPKSLLGATLDCVVMQLKIKLGEKSVRRATHIVELVGYDPNREQIVLNDAFRWDPAVDKFAFSGRSRLYEKITKRYGTPIEKIRKDVDDRKVFLESLVARNIRGYAQMSQMIRDFYSDPEGSVQKARESLQVGVTGNG